MKHTLQARRDSLRETRAILNHYQVCLPATAEFIDDTYVLGLYAGPKVYTRQARPHVKALDAAIVQLALKGATIRSDQPNLAPLVFQLADIRQRVEGHYWRAERIVEDYQERKRLDEAAERALRERDDRISGLS